MGRGPAAGLGRGSFVGTHVFADTAPEVGEPLPDEVADGVAVGGVAAVEVAEGVDVAVGACVAVSAGTVTTGEEGSEVGVVDTPVPPLEHENIGITSEGRPRAAR